MAERGMRLKLGGFVAGTLAVLAALVVLFGGAPNLLSNKAKYTVVFPEAPGIAQGTPIRKSGVRIGEVADLDLDPATGQVRVGIVVDRKFLPRRSENATISRGILNGDTTIDFLPRLADDGKPVPLREPYEQGTEIAGLPPVTARSILSQAQGVIPTAQQSLDRIVITFEKLEQLTPKLERTLDEITALAKAGREFVPELRRTNNKLQNLLGSDTPEVPVAFAAAPVVPGSAIPIVPRPADPRNDPNNLRALIAEARDFLRSLKPAVEDARGVLRRAEPEITATAKAARGTLDSARLAFENVNEVLSPDNRKQFGDLTRNLVVLSGNIIKLTTALGGLIDEAENTIKGLNARVVQFEPIINDIKAFTKPLGEKADRIITNADLTLDNLAKGVVEIRTITQGFGKADGSIGRLLSDPVFYNNLNDATASLARVLVRTERVMKDVEVFADKIARKPETLGAGGLVRPNSGLKESPTAPLPSYRPDWPPATPPRLGPGGGSSLLPPVQGYPPSGGGPRP